MKFEEVANLFKNLATESEKESHFHTLPIEFMGKQLVICLENDAIKIGSFSGYNNQVSSIRSYIKLRAQLLKGKKLVSVERQYSERFFSSYGVAPSISLLTWRYDPKKPLTLFKEEQENIIFMLKNILSIINKALSKENGFEIANFDKNMEKTQILRTNLNQFLRKKNNSKYSLAALSIWSLVENFGDLSLKLPLPAELQDEVKKANSEYSWIKKNV